MKANCLEYIPKYFKNIQSVELLRIKIIYGNVCRDVYK